MLVATRWSHHAGKRHGSGRQDAHDMERHIRMVTDAVMCNCVSVNNAPDIVTGVDGANYPDR